MKSIIGAFLFLICILGLVIISHSHKAILFSSSLGYYNIRQVNNIVKMYHHFRSNGFSDDDILLIIAEMQPCCEKNHRFGTLSFYDGDYENIFKGVEVDYYHSGVYLESVAQIFMGYYGKHTPNMKKLILKADQPLFIYITGHGGDLYFKVRQRQAIINQQFNAIFATLSLKQIASKVALISDSCSAITPFQNVTAPNFIALGSSSYGEKSLSHGFDAVLNQPKTDDFSYYFDEILLGKANFKGLKNLDSWSFHDLNQYMDVSKLKVNSKLIFNRINKGEKITNFIKKQEPKTKIKTLKNIKDAKSFFNL